jgi:hypothetical protein
MVLISNGPHRGSTTADQWRWLDKIGILSENVNGRWRHRLIAGGPTWAEYLLKVETRRDVD